MGTGFGKRYERKHPEGGWERLDDLNSLKVGDVVRMNESNGLTVSTIKRAEGKTEFIANRLDAPRRDDEYIVLMHLEGLGGDFPPEKFPLPDQIPWDQRKPAAAKPIEELWPKHAEAEGPGPLPEKGNDPKPYSTAIAIDPQPGFAPAPGKKSSFDVIRELLAGGAEKTVDDLISGFAAVGKIVKADTVKWTLGQMVKTGETEKTVTGTWKLRTK